MFIIIIFTWDKTFLLRNRSSCGGICVCVCVLWGREKLLWQRCVKHQPRGGADIDGLSEIQQCGNRRRTNSSLMRSHLLSLPCLSLFFFFAARSPHFLKSRTRSTKRGPAQYSESRLDLLSLASPSLRYNNSYCSGCFMDVYVQWGMPYVWHHNSLTVFGVNKLPVTSKLLCFPLLSPSSCPVWASSNPLCLSMQEQEPPIYGEMPFYYSFACTAHSWPGHMKYCRLNRSRHIPTDRFFGH